MGPTPEKTLHRLERRRHGSWRDLLAAPNDQLWTSARRGEWTIALLRLVLITGVVLITTVLALLRPDSGPSWIAHLLAWGAWATAAGLLRLAGSRWSPRPAGLVSTQIDVAWVTSVLLVGGLATDVFSTGVSWLPAAYVVVIAASTLRLDRRIAFLTGMAAMLQYTALVVLSIRRPIQFPGLAMASFSYTSPAGHLAHLGAHAAVTVIAVATIAAIEHLLRQPTVDRLTGLFGKRYFLDRLGDEIARFERAPESFTIGLIEIAVPRALRRPGPRAEALRAVASLLAREFRSSDTVARLYDSQFAVLLCSSDHRVAVDRFDHVCAEIERLEIEVADRAEPVQVSARAGVASSAEPNCGPWKVFGLARERLAVTQGPAADRVTGPVHTREAPPASPVSGNLVAVQFGRPGATNPSQVSDPSTP